MRRYKNRYFISYASIICFACLYLLKAIVPVVKRFFVVPCSVSGSCEWVHFRDALLSIFSVLKNSFIHKSVMFTFYISLIIDSDQEFLLFPLPV